MVHLVWIPGDCYLGGTVKFESQSTKQPLKKIARYQNKNLHTLTKGMISSTKVKGIIL